MRRWPQVDEPGDAPRTRREDGKVTSRDRTGGAPSAFAGLVPLLMCEDVPGQIRFYTEVLGFTVMDRMDDLGASGFASLQSGGAQIMLASPTYVPKAPRVEDRYPQSAYYVYVSDADGLRSRVADAGWPATECVNRFYGLREFEVVDPEGHVLLFGQNIEVPDTHPEPELPPRPGQPADSHHSPTSKSGQETPNDDRP